MISKMFQFVEQHLFKRIYHEHIIKSGGTVWDFGAIIKVMGQKIVQFQIPFVVLGNTNKAGLGSVPKINPQNWFYAEFRCFSNKVQSCRGVVDIGKYQLGHMVLLRQLQ